MIGMFAIISMFQWKTRKGEHNFGFAPGRQSLACYLPDNNSGGIGDLNRLSLSKLDRSRRARNVYDVRRESWVEMERPSPRPLSCAARTPAVGNDEVA